jgi:hypothetical protein
MKKTCSICKLNKNTSEFYTYKRSDKLYYHSYCKPCKNQKAKYYMNKHYKNKIGYKIYLPHDVFKEFKVSCFYKYHSDKINLPTIMKD